MAVYQITFKSGAQQFMEMDLEEANMLTEQWVDWTTWDDMGRPENYRVEPSQDKVPDRIYAASTGATVDVSQVAGLQHYITPKYAEARANDPENVGADMAEVIHDDLTRALRVAIQAMMENAEVEEGLVVATDERPVVRAFFEALAR